MPDNTISALVEHYRCAEDYQVERAASRLLAKVIDDLRYERYVKQHRGALERLARELYYTVRPMLPAGLRKYLHRIHLNDWQKIPFPSWPVDRTVETIFEKLAMLSIENASSGPMPFVWFWPNGYSGCVILTHDVETEAGRDLCSQLIDLDASFGMKSSFQIVPEERYEVPLEFLDLLRSRGREVNIHGLNHDGRLFRDRRTFLERVKRINEYAREYGASGFRSPMLYRNLDWYSDFQFSYDMSVPNVAHLDPQRGGCCTVMPYFVGDILELPLTMTQDWSLFNVLGETSIALWKEQIDLVLEKHGLVSFNIHPDYIMADPYRSLYEELLEYLAALCAGRKVWIALPGEVNQWWRQRHEMSVNEHAGVAYASVDHGHVVYDLPDPVTAWHPPHQH